jgi:putative SOS response-associated peptidase YedK
MGVGLASSERVAIRRRGLDGLDDKAITSFAIVTTDAASATRYHNRMPVVLADSEFDE